MWRDQKGFAWLVVIKWFVRIVAIAVILFATYIIGKGGWGRGGGEGDNDGEGNNVEILEEAENPTPILEELEYVSVSVDGNDYIYQNNKMTLDELITQIMASAEKAPIRIIDANASRNAYTSLIEALRDNHIRYIE